MTLDIRSATEGWAFQPDEVTVRTITGDDGGEKIQLRLDLGLMQMELDGRPDGRRIEGHESWLDLHASRQREREGANPDSAPYLLAPEDCAELMREGVQYYHRYICFWALQRYELCARDTKRNLRLFHFVREHARLERDKLQFDQWRPYVTMMHARAVATPLVETRQTEAALAAIDAGIRGIERFLADYGREDQAEQVHELTFLHQWRHELVGSSKAHDPVAELRERLAAAIAGERYEEAAELRDQLARFTDPRPPQG
ncbi:MAG: UvrB/UvrC motif-containing protein [Lacipirellulaceae bacterium]